jgi:transcriptional regulator with XRE-family HTH domain
MKLKGLTQKDVQRRSGGRITDGYVASIVIGRASNPSVDKLKALADGLGEDAVKLFQIACGLPEHTDAKRKSSSPPDLMLILETVQKAVVIPDFTEILHELLRLSAEDRTSFRRSLTRLAATRAKQKRKPRKT